MYRGRGYPRKTLVAVGPEGGACAVACVCLHAGTYKVLAQVQNTYVCKVHTTPNLLTRHDLHTQLLEWGTRSVCDLCVIECRRTNQLNTCKISTTPTKHHMWSTLCTWKLPVEQNTELKTSTWRSNYIYQLKKPRGRTLLLLWQGKVKASNLPITNNTPFPCSLLAMDDTTRLRLTKIWYLLPHS